MGSCALRARFPFQAQCARFRIRVAKAAFEPAHGTHVGRSRDEQVECSVRTSVSVRRRALSMLLGHGVLGHEPLSVCEVA